MKLLPTVVNPLVIAACTVVGLAGGPGGATPDATRVPGNEAISPSRTMTVSSASSGLAPSVDTSSPRPTAVKNDVASTTSSSFSPRAGTVVYAIFSMDSASYNGRITKVTSVRNSGLPLAWHLLGRHNAYSSVAGGFVEVWWAANPTSQSGIAATGTFSQRTKNVTPPVGDFQILVMDNAAADQSSAAWHARALLTDTTNTPEARVATSRANSLVFGVFNNWDNAERPAPESNQTIDSIVLNTADVDGYWVQKQRAPTPGVGTSVLMRAHDPGKATQWRVLAWEVLAR